MLQVGLGGGTCPLLLAPMKCVGTLTARLVNTTMLRHHSPQVHVLEA